MSIERQLYDTDTLLGVLREVPPPSNYWLNLCFNQTIAFEDEWIDLSKIDGMRKVAPFVVPTAQGKPIYSAGERTYRFKAAYLKPKDAVTASRMIRRRAGFGELLAARPLTPAQRYAAVIADIGLQHRDAILRRWEWMAAQAVQFGANTLEGDGYPRTLVDYGRDPDHQVILGAGARWGDPGVSILSGIESWRSIVRRSKFGGSTDRMTVGAMAWDKLKSDPEIKELLNINYRIDSAATLNLGLREGLDIEYVGKLSGTLDVYVYSDYYQSPDGTVVPYMDPRDIVLTGPNVRGVQCFGAILDTRANFQPLPIFPKVWDSEDPSGTYYMTQSAPLMVPLNPNNTFRARVVA